MDIDQQALALRKKFNSLAQRQVILDHIKEATDFNPTYAEQEKARDNQVIGYLTAILHLLGYPASTTIRVALLKEINYQLSESPKYDPTHITSPVKPVS